MSLKIKLFTRERDPILEFQRKQKKFERWYWRQVAAGKKEAERIALKEIQRNTRQTHGT